jgi:pre-mRNA-processing factor 19
MSFNICSLSGNLVEVPVISKKSGHVFEKRLIEKHIDATGQCPITGTELTKDDLLEIKTSKATKPRSSATTNIPSLLSNLQSEWDTLMLETFNMKHQLDQVRQELSHSLYQHDAACRVICRLIKERDDARNQLANIRTDLDNIQEEEEEKIGEEFENMGIYKELLERMNEIFQTLSSNRKKREISSDLVSLPVIRIINLGFKCI